MFTTSDLPSILDRIANNTYTDADLSALQHTIDENQYFIVTGERAVAVGGDTTDAIIVTGDNNVIRIYKGSDAETILAIVEQVIQSTKPPTLLSYEDFVARAEHSGIIDHQAPLVGRKELLSELTNLLKSETQVVVIHGAGGIGKTRLLLSLAEIVAPDIHLWYVRTEAETVEWEINNLAPNSKHIIVVDDAHRFSNLYQLREALINPNLVNRIKIILVTRSVFRDTVISQLSPPRGLLPISVELVSLSNAEVDEFLANHPYSITDKNKRNLILRIAEGNPLFAGISAKLIMQGKSLEGLNRDQVFVNYLQNVIQDLADANYSDKYLAFIEILAALGTINLSNQQLRERIQEVIGINKNEEERMVTRLVASGLVERYWMLLKLSSEVIADHILIHHFFDSETRQADFQTQIIDPFFSLMPKEILENLSRAEVKTESLEIGTVVGQKLTEMLRFVRQGGNQDRLTILDWLEDVAYLRPDDALAILACIIDGPENADEIYQDRAWGRIEVTHEMVLGKVVDLLEHTVYRGGLQNAIQNLYKLAIYKPSDKRFESIREKSQKKILELAEFKPRKPFNVQLTLLGAIEIWIEQINVDEFGWIVDVLQTLLKMEYMSAETDPTEPHKVVITQGTLPPLEHLRHIRSKTISILINLYSQASNIRERLKVVKALGESAPFFMPDIKIPPETFEWMKTDWQEVATFYSKTVIPFGEYPVIDVVDNWSKDKRRFGGSFPAEIEAIQVQIGNLENFQLYYLLIGWHRLDPEEDWREAEERRKTAVIKYADSISPNSIDQVIDDLETIISQSHDVGENGFQYFDMVLRRLGENRSNLVAQIIEQATNGDLVIKHHLDGVLAGLRTGSNDQYHNYTADWLSSQDPILWLAIAQSYRYINWTDADTNDWTILQKLVDKGDRKVNFQVLSYIWRFAPFNNTLAVEILKYLSDRGNELVLNQIAQALDFPNDGRDGWAIEFDNPQDYLAIIQNFERLPSLDYHAERALDRLGELDPMQAVDFIEQRIENSVQRRLEIDNYRSVPFGMFRAFDRVRTSPQYLDVLRRVQDWMLREEGLYRLMTPDILKSIAGAIDGSLHKVLMEWIESKELEKIQAAASILREFNSGPPFYNICREIILRTDDEKTLGTISAAIHTTPGVISGPMSNFTKQRIDEVSPWLQDTDYRVRGFGKRTIQDLERTLERELAQEEYEEKNWMRS